jgi:hypothetical protein
VPTLTSAVSNRQMGDKIPFGPDKPALLVVGISERDQPDTPSPSRRNN